ncbi:MAG: hypothetical protein ABI112_15405 [Terracoccus sp.]
MIGPITVALVDDYDVVLIGVAHIMDRYRDRVLIAEIDTNKPLHDTVDIALYDSFAQPESDRDEIAVLVANPHARRVVVYTWTFHPDLIESAKKHGVRGTSPRPSRPATSSPPSNKSIPASSSSARHPGGHDPTPGSTGPGAQRA